MHTRRDYYRLGMNAYMAGISRSDCPFIYEHAVELWELGWFDAKAEFEATNPELFKEV